MVLVHKLRTELFGEGQQVSKQELGYMSAGARENEGSGYEHKESALGPKMAYRVSA